MKQAIRVSPEGRFGRSLLGVQMPGRYTGGEYGSIHKPEAPYRVCVSYPDLYEIGMSNQAIQILYTKINSLGKDIACERVFAPAPDFEALLKDTGTPIYGLEEGTPLDRFDLIGFSLGYELTLTNLFTILDAGGVPIPRADRGEGDPLVIAGGPGVTNPLPLADFLDAVYIGEWEAGVDDLVRDLADMKKRGAHREDMLNRVGRSPGMWLPERGGTVTRQIYPTFAAKKERGWIVPNIHTVQDHGVVEIMRGCPSGCRFCHAGMIYRPQREKPIDLVLDEVDYLVRRCGYREITLSSLSSADYSRIGSLVSILNRRYMHEGVSFSLPSLHINTFTLGLLEEVSRVRKSGLTFAVETPEEVWQRSINKEVSRDAVLRIMREAVKSGWNQAKLYFMIGLPVTDPAVEGESIIDFCRQVQKDAGMKLHINIGTFVPKPHTPFQWSRQLTDDVAFDTLLHIKKSLENRKIKVNFHSPFISFLEGVLSRGDERAGRLFYEAYARGARLDSWEDHLDRRLWKDLLSESSWDVEEESCRERDLRSPLPWNMVRTGVSEAFLRREYEKAKAGEITAPCTEPCDHPCGICSPGAGLVYADESEYPMVENSVSPEAEKAFHRVLIRFSKKDAAVYLSHINIMTVFERSLQRAGISVAFSEGFNPKPRLEFARPLSLGVASEGEYLRADIDSSMDCTEVSARLNRALPEGLGVEGVQVIRRAEKRESLMKLYWGALYRIKAEDKDLDALIPKLPEYMKVTAREPGRLDLLVEEGSGKGPSPARFLQGLTGDTVYSKVYILKRIQQYAKSSDADGGYRLFEELLSQSSD